MTGPDSELSGELRQRPVRPPRPRNAAQRDFARRVNHTLRGDAHAAHMALSAALEQTRALSLLGSTREAFARVERAITYLERRTLDVALLTQVDTSMLALSRQLHRLRWVIEDAVREHRKQAEEKDVALRVDLATFGTTSAPLDRDLMVRALGALLDNAIRFSPYGGIVTIHSAISGGSARITVRDQGSGFAPGDAKRVFARFAVGKNVEDGTGNGLGLGLAVARAIVEAHGGRIQVVKSKEPGGAVAIELPLA